MAIERIGIEIRSNTREIDRELAQIDQSIKNLKRSRPEIRLRAEQLERAKDSIRNVELAMRQLRARQAELRIDSSSSERARREIQEIQRAMNILRSRQATLRVETQQLQGADRELTNLNREMTRLNNRRAVLQVDHADIMQAETALGRLRARLNSLSGSGARIDISGNFDRLGTQLDNISNKMFGLIKTAGLVTGALSGMVVGKSLKAFGDFEQTMNQVQSVSDATAKELKTLSGEVKQLGADSVFSATEVGQAALELAKGGLSVAQLQAGALKNTIDLAAASGLNMEESAIAISNAMNTFGLEAEETTRIVNAFAGGANASSADVSDLTFALAQVGSGAVNAGMDINETVAALAAFADNGVKGSDAGTSLKTMLARLIPQTKQAAGAMDTYGLSFADANGNMDDMRTIAGKLKKALGGLSEAERISALNTIFGSDASRAASILMREGAAGIESYIIATEDLTAAQRVAESRMKGWNGLIERTSGSIETLAIVTGEKSAKMFEPLVSMVEKFADRTSNFFAENEKEIDQWVSSSRKKIESFIKSIEGFDWKSLGKGLIDSFENIRNTITSVWNVISPIGKSIANVLGGGNTEKGIGRMVGAFVTLTISTKAVAIGLKTVSFALRGFGTAFKVIKGAVNVFKIVKNAITGLRLGMLALNAVMAANPIGFVLTAVTGLVAGIIYLWKTNEGFRNVVIKTWDSIKNAFVNAADLAKGAWDSFTGFFSNLGKTIKSSSSNIANSISGAWDGFINFFADLWDGMKKSAISAWEGLKSDVSAIASSFVNSLVSFFTPVVEWFKTMFEPLGEFFNTLWTNISTIASAGWELIKASVLGPALLLLDLLTLDFENFKSDLALIWDSIRTSVVTIFTTIRDTVIGYFEAATQTGLNIWNSFKEGMMNLFNLLIEGVISTWNSFKESFVNLALATRDGVVATWNSLKESVINAANAIVSSVVSSWENLKQSTFSALGTIKQFFVDTWNNIKTSTLSTIEAIVNGAKNAWESLKSSVKDAVNNVRETLKSLANINLMDAGRAIVKGFLDGLKSGFESVKTTVRGWADWIRDNKGPISYDKRLLIDNGLAIASGLDKGLIRGFENIKSTVSAMADTISQILGGSLENLPSPTIDIPVRKLSNGGFVNNDSGINSGYFKRSGTDTVPAMLTPGEFVQKREAVSTFGLDFMKNVNNLDIKGAFHAMTRRFGTHNMVKPSVSSVINNINNSTTNNNANKVTMHANGGNPDYIMKRVSKYL